MAMEGVRESLIGGARWHVHRAPPADPARRVARRARRRRLHLPPRARARAPSRDPRALLMDANADSHELWAGVDAFVGRVELDDALRGHRLHLLAARRRRAAGLPGPRRAAGSRQRQAAIDSLAVPVLLARARAAYGGRLVLMKGRRRRGTLPRPAHPAVRRRGPARRRRRGGAGRPPRSGLPGGRRPREVPGHPPSPAARAAGTPDRDRGPQPSQVAAGPAAGADARRCSTRPSSPTTGSDACRRSTTRCCSPSTPGRTRRSGGSATCSMSRR